MSLDELKLPKNNLFKLTCRDHHDSANYTFTWELTSKGSELLQENSIRFPFMYVFAVEELPASKIKGHAEGCGCRGCGGHSRVVEEELFCLHEGAGQLQFHKSGEFKIYAMVIWDYGRADPTWRSHRSHVRKSLDFYSRSILEGDGDLKGNFLSHVEEDAIHIGSSFFANTPNPILWWWANLWFDSEPVNTCQYRNRLWFAPGLLIKVPVVSVYVVIRGFLMFMAFLGSLLIAMRPSFVHWRPMFHAFSSTWGQMFEFSESKSNWAFRAKGAEEDRGVFGTIIRMPFVWIGSPSGIYYLIRSITHYPKAYLGVVLGLVLIVGVALGLHYLTQFINSRRKSVHLYYEVVPVEQPKKRRIPLRVRWLDAKGQMCLPYPK